ncbi:DNA mismatch repair protein MutS [Candidatus Babeliales bacterium]|nr:DNA mismatch repair protein MutS [Candidatus Babeliales bacterium]
MTDEKLTPLMQQYFNIRKQYPSTLLFFQVGDFYELFFEDAKIASAFLAIALTKRGKCKGKDVPLCGIPVHALNHYLKKLVKGGFRVGICDQLSEPKPGMVVERGVTRVYTPGTLTDAQMMDDKSASYLFAFYPSEKEWGLVFGELLTAQIFATTIPAGEFRILESELARFFPDEVIISDQKFETYFKKNGYWVTNDSFLQDIENSDQWVNKSFDNSINEKLKEKTVIKNALLLFHQYLFKTQKFSLEQFKTIQFYESDDYLYLDISTQKNLEIVRNNIDSSRKNTLLSVVDHSKTAMGSRTLTKWLTRPLLQKKAILQRLQVVKTFKNNVDIIQKLGELLGELSDLERIVGRIGLYKAPIQDYIALKQSLKILPYIKNLLSKYLELDLIKIILSRFINFDPLITLLENALEEGSSSGHIVKYGFNSSLDRIRNLVENSQKELIALEAREIEKTGINSLKIRYNKVSGYVIEVTKTHLDKIPEYYKRLQSLTNRERFVTEELLALQNEIIKAQNEIGSLEAEVFQQIKDQVHSKLSFLRHCAGALAYLDGLYSFAKVAYENNYIEPVFNDSGEISIRGGKHPVVASSLDSFVSNDTTLNSKELLWIVTGPNMGGKSTYLRQVALISILAQCGSLVPAEEANLPFIDRIFTRIGSGDNLVEGKSTFLVEMEETSIICRHATKNSLVILDEVGRGTSTFDGLAIAQAVIEYIYEKIGSKCLFATHYHELTHLKDHFSGIKNYHMLCKKKKDGIVFLHKIEQGISNGSFGIDVAKLANMPAGLINRARDILHMLETSSQVLDKNLHTDIVESDSVLKEKVFILEKELKRKDGFVNLLKNLNFDDLSPKKAFDILWELKKQI